MESSLVSLSPPELRRLAALERHLAGDLDQAQVSLQLGLSVRQVKRLLRRYRSSGPAGLVSARRGRSNRSIDPEKIEQALEIIRHNYPDFGPTFAAEKLAERHGLNFDHETLRRAMIRAGLWGAAKRKGRVQHLPRERRACFGELVQLDASIHRWFEKRGPRTALHVAIDDATSTLLGLHLDHEECARGYFALLAVYLRQYGRPQAFYTDRHGIFKPVNQSFNGEKRTQFGQAMDDLDIELICATSPQAKGRVERVNGTLQDRLVKELRLRGICDIESANAYLPEYIAGHNRCFAREPASDHDAHRALEEGLDLQELLSFKQRRTVGSAGTLSYKSRLFALDSAAFKHMTSRKVDVQELPTGTIVISQYGKALRFLELPPGRPSIQVLSAKQIAKHQPRKGRTPAADHPWEKSMVSLAPKGTFLMSSRGHQT